MEGVHFSFHYMMPYDVGHRLMTANLSDIAAMGGIPRQIVLSVAAPDYVDTVILDGSYRGIKDQCMQISTQYTGWRYGTSEDPWFDCNHQERFLRGTAVMREWCASGIFVGVTNYVGCAAQV
ncbi:MAG: AIR synthase related protein [Veillonella sp.]